MLASYLEAQIASTFALKDNQHQSKERVIGKQSVRPTEISHMH